MNVKDYWIDELKEIKEFRVIDDKENVEIVKLNTEIQNLIDDQFIETATERGIARREKILKIIPFSDDTPETRRFRVLSRWNAQLPYSYRVLLNKLNQMCGENGYVATLNSGEYTLNIRIELTQKRMFNEVDITTRKMAPCNIAVTVELRYNQHQTLSRFTHAQLSSFTHEQLRSEVIT